MDPKTTDVDGNQLGRPRWMQINARRVDEHQYQGGVWRWNMWRCGMLLEANTSDENRLKGDLLKRIGNP